MEDTSRATLVRFGAFELDLKAGQLLRNGRLVRLQPQPFKLLCLLANQPGRLVTREEFRWRCGRTTRSVDFEQGVNFIKQVRDALGDQAERSVYIQTEPKRGYRFLAPVTSAAALQPPGPGAADPELEKALWANITELARRRSPPQTAKAVAHRGRGGRSRADVAGVGEMVNATDEVLPAEKLQGHPFAPVTVPVHMLRLRSSVPV